MKYKDAVITGIISGIGFSMIVVSALFIQRVKENQILIANEISANHREALARAKDICYSDKIEKMNYVRGEGKQFRIEITCGRIDN